MEKLEIIGGKKISGTIVISGSKNSTLPILASTILTNKKVVIKNIPIVKDVKTMADLLSVIGSDVKLNLKEKKNSNFKQKAIKNFRSLLSFKNNACRCISARIAISKIWYSKSFTSRWM